ncbi:MAG TPA: hypothetical protein PLD73_18825 [Candidatus Hydrogenedentes bacterium]|nr:hypothetical protein [Candidatus Hydrogenedentota bacterium]
MGGQGVAAEKGPVYKSFQRLSTLGKDKKMARPVRFERTTSCSGGTQQSIVSAENEGLAEIDSDACTNACTKFEDDVHANRLEAIAEAIRNLSAKERQRLLQMLGKKPEHDTE